MLTDAILIIIAAVLNTVISILPYGETLPASLDTSIQWFSDQIAQWSNLFPFIGTLITVLLLIITIEGFIFLYGGVNWTINKVRGSG